MVKKVLIVGVAYACLLWLISFVFMSVGMTGALLDGIDWIFSFSSFIPALWIIVLILASVIIMAVILIRIFKNSTIKKVALMCLISLFASIITVILMYGSLSFTQGGWWWWWDGWRTVGTIVLLVLATQPILFFAIILTLVYLAIRKLWINYAQKH